MKGVRCGVVPICGGVVGPLGARSPVDVTANQQGMPYSRRLEVASQVENGRRGGEPAFGHSEVAVHSPAIPHLVIARHLIVGLRLDMDEMVDDLVLDGPIVVELVRPVEGHEPGLILIGLGHSRVDVRRYPDELIGVRVEGDQLPVIEDGGIVGVLHL